MSYLERSRNERSCREKTFERDERGAMWPKIGEPVFGIQTGTRVGDLAFLPESQDRVLCDREAAIEIASGRIVWELRRIA